MICSIIKKPLRIGKEAIFPIIKFIIENVKALNILSVVTVFKEYNQY